MKKRYVIIILLIIFGGLAYMGFHVLNKNIRITPYFAGKYELCGIDVSHYQGRIDWKKIEEQNIDFVFIKATEGSSHVDECFEDNWNAAQQTNLIIGAYHFFSFDSAGKTQAENYISTVGSLDGKLTPVIDIEYYGDKRTSVLDKEEITSQLKEMLTVLEQHYQTKPIIYTTYMAYHDYIKSDFNEYPLWLRNIYYPPVFMNWTFWQYSDTAILDGYEGDEKYIDMNVFHGAREDMENLIVTKNTEPDLKAAVMILEDKSDVQYSVDKYQLVQTE